ncbi:unnamed protein product [Closterium sp. NIES-65]|nr:unnamed protein product [Closterium sp. NIES-65]
MRHPLFNTSPRPAEESHRGVRTASAAILRFFLCPWQCTFQEMARREGALHVRIPAPGFFQRGAVGWIMCLLAPLFLILAVAASFFFVGTFWLLLGIAISTISWVGVATRRESVTLGPDAFSIVHTRYGVSKKREGSTHLVHSILVVDRNAPRLLHPPQSTTAPGIPVPGPTPPTAAAPAAASGSAPTARRGPAAAAAATANARARETPAEPPELVCVFALPGTVHRFGANLSDAEKYWVVGELAYYLQSVRLHLAQQNV